MTDRYAELREALVQIDALDPEGHTAGFSVDALRGLIERMGAIARAALKEAPAYAEAETDMTDYAELLRHLRLLARGKHDDVSIAADAAGAIIALLAERDELAVRLAAAQHQPAEGEEIMVNTPYDVFILPLRPSGLDGKGPRFVVHVPGPDAQVMPDWDAAPPGATHYQPHQDAYYKRVSASEWYVWSRKNDREPMQWHPSLGTGDNAEWVVRPAEQPTEQHPDDAAVDRFAVAMKAKLNKKRQEGRGGWQSMTAEQLSALLHEHVRKGDPVDVANLAMMLHQNGQVIELPEPPVNVVTDEMVEAVQRIWKTAMRQSVVARMPECGEFGGIAQDADWLLDVLMEARND